MERPSLAKLRSQTLTTFKRFPLAIISAIIATIAYIGLVESNEDEIFYIAKMAVVAMLGIPLFTVISLMAEKRQWNISIRVAVTFLGFALLFGYYFLLPDELEPTFGYVYYRYILYFIGLHLLVAVGPYWGKDQIIEFWQYNKTLFLRILTAALFSAVLFLGLAAALGSVQILFQVDINFDWYQELFLVIAGIFNTWFFLSGIPKPIQKLDSVSSYPKGLKIFARNVLLPLVAIYMIILYVYAGMIVIHWEWPQGWVSMLILFFSIFGILAILLLYPLRSKADNQWINRFSKSYYWILFPLSIFLILAIWRRISEYGFTVERYFVFILGFWLLGLVIYFIFSKKQNIKIIPTSLCIIAFAVSFGPWGAFAVSERSQINRLQTILQNNGLLRNGSVHSATHPLSGNEFAQVNSILRYINRTHSLNSLQPWFDKDLDQITSDKNEFSRNNAKQIIQFLGIESSENGKLNEGKQGKFYTGRNPVIATQQIDWLIKDDIYWPLNNSMSYNVGERTLIIEQDDDLPHIQVYLKNSKQQAVNINLNTLINSLLQQADDHQTKLPSEMMTFKFSNQSLQVVIYLDEIGWEGQKDSIDVEYANFRLGISNR